MNENKWKIIFTVVEFAVSGNIANWVGSSAAGAGRANPSCRGPYGSRFLLQEGWGPIPYSFSTSANDGGFSTGVIPEL